MWTSTQVYETARIHRPKTKLYASIALFSANLYSLCAKRRGHDYTFLGFRYSVIAAAYGCLLVCSGTLEGEFTV